MQKVIVQVPMPKELKEKAEKVSIDYGFSSLQETIRVFLAKLSKQELTITLQEKTEEITDLSPAAEKRYKKALQDIKAGRNVTKTKNIDEFLQLLRS